MPKVHWQPPKPDGQDVTREQDRRDWYASERIPHLLQILERNRGMDSAGMPFAQRLPFEEDVLNELKAIWSLLPTGRASGRFGPWQRGLCCCVGSQQGSSGSQGMTWALLGSRQEYFIHLHAYMDQHFNVLFKLSVQPERILAINSRATGFKVGPPRCSNADLRVHGRNDAGAQVEYLAASDAAGKELGATEELRQAFPKGGASDRRSSAPPARQGRDPSRSRRDTDDEKENRRGASGGNARSRSQKPEGQRRPEEALVSGQSLRGKAPRVVAGCQECAQMGP